MTSDGLLHYIIYRMDQECEIRRVLTPDGYACLVEVGSFMLLFDKDDINVLAKLEESLDWIPQSTLHIHLTECLETGRAFKNEK